MNCKLKKGVQYSVCSCGLSKIMPFCDNAHREYNKRFSTDYKSIKIISDKDTTIKVSCSHWDTVKEDIQ
tara:strand:- start:645 stop:851 length:207 start_codon:yes stop_codon:yes gene_type:complete